MDIELEMQVEMAIVLFVVRFQRGGGRSGDNFSHLEYFSTQICFTDYKWKILYLLKWLQQMTYCVFWQPYWISHWNFFKMAKSFWPSKICRVYDKRGLFSSTLCAALCQVDGWGWRMQFTNCSKFITFYIKSSFLLADYNQGNIHRQIFPQIQSKKTTEWAMLTYICPYTCCSTFTFIRKFL